MRIETLTRMGQQIARNNEAVPPDEAVDRITTHLRSFWTPSMIRELSDYAAANPADLDPVLVDALVRLGTAADT